jgi:hypothetical protein
LNFHFKKNIFRGLKCFLLEATQDRNNKSKELREKNKINTICYSPSQARFLGLFTASKYDFGILESVRTRAEQFQKFVSTRLAAISLNRVVWYCIGSSSSSSSSCMVGAVLQCACKTYAMAATTTSLFVYACTNGVCVLRKMLIII